MIPEPVFDNRTEAAGWEVGVGEDGDTNRWLKDNTVKGRIEDDPQNREVHHYAFFGVGLGDNVVGAAYLGSVCYQRAESKT